MAKLAGGVAPRLNHYETLGVRPTAAGDEIARAFAREGSVYRAHAFGGLAEVCIAYETLSDPIRRRAYDASIGLKREPSLPRAPVAQPVVAKPKAALPTIDPVPPRVPKPEPAFRLGSAVDSHVVPEPRISPGSSPRLSLEEELGVEVRPVDWRRTGFVLGGVVVAACVIGGLAGWWSSSAIGEAPQPGNAVSVSLPPAKFAATPETPPIAVPPVESMPEVRVERPEPSVAMAEPLEDSPIASEAATTEEPPQETLPGSSLAEQAVEETSAAPTVTASMPLPDRVIARTIERIGYSCGSVASTAPVEGEASGVFKVTCSSGQSYQARPVKGRYHFRRWGRR